MIRKLCFVLCGIALTWTCAGAGLFLLGWGHGCRGGDLRATVWRAREVEQGLTQYLLDHDRCPTSRDELIADHYVAAESLTDPWGKAIAYSCSADGVKVVSAGPDKTFHTADDVAAR